MFKRQPKGNTLRFVIPGKPAAKQSMKVATVTDKNGFAVLETTKKGKQKVKLHKYQDKKTENNEVYIKWCIAAQKPFGFEPWEGPIRVIKLLYVFPHTKESRKKNGIVYKATRPDVNDNLNKMVFDAMNNLIYKDDAQIVSLRAVDKIYGSEPRIEIILEKL